MLPQFCGHTSCQPLARRRAIFSGEYKFAGLLPMARLLIIAFITMHRGSCQNSASAGPVLWHFMEQNSAWAALNNSRGTVTFSITPLPSFSKQNTQPQPLLLVQEEGQ